MSSKFSFITRLGIVSICLVCLTAADGAAQDVIWDYNDSGGVYTARPMPDVNNDGVDDVIFAGYYSDYGDVLYCVSGADGSTFWTRDYDDCKGVWGVKGLTSCPDMDGDGVAEVVMGTPGGYDPPGRCVIVKSGATGDTIWYWSCYQGGLNAGWVYSVKVIPDITGDGYEEIIAACGTWGGSPGVAVCLAGGTSGGTPLWTFRPADAVEDIIAIDDITMDGIPEVVCVSGGNGDDHTLYCIDGASTGTVTAPVWSLVLESDGWSLANAGDLDRDGISDIFVSCYQAFVNGGVYAVSGIDGSEIWSDISSTSMMEVAALPDVDGDGAMEMVVGSWSSLARCYSGGHGALLWTSSVGADCWNVEVIDDIDLDGHNDVLAGALNGKVAKFISGIDGTVLAETPTYGERIYDVEVLSDVSGDGIRDVALCFQDQTAQPQCLICYTGRPSSVVVPTVSCAVTCVPAWGTVPFNTTMTVTLTNNFTGQARRLAAHLDAHLGGGQQYGNWRAGWSNVAAGSSFSSSWNQTIPALASVIGNNVFSLSAEDVTPAPYNQPPYPPAGDTDTASCTVTGVEP